MAALRGTPQTVSGNGVTTAFVDVTVVAGDRVQSSIYERDGGAITSVVSNQDGGLTQDAQRAAVAAQVAGYSLIATTTGTHRITILFGVNRVFAMTVSVIDGQAAGTILTGNAGGGSTTNHQCGTVTPPAAHTVVAIWGGGSDNGGVTPGADGMTALPIDPSTPRPGCAYFQYKLGHTGAIDADFQTTNSIPFDAVILAFPESTAPSTSGPLVAGGATAGHRRTRLAA